jgi:hypothetical protein
MLTKTRLLFLVILIEGYVVLATELLAIRQLIPFVGSGTETISIVISAVLLPLAFGYHFGGRAFAANYVKARAKGRKPPSIRGLLLRNILVSLAILTFGMSYVFMELFFGLLEQAGLHNRLLQTALYSVLFLVWPVFLLGQTVPLVSNYFSSARLSEITGKMLFFSTAGSFLGSVFSTIVLMMTIGVHNTVLVTMGMLVVLTLLLVRRWFAYEVWATLALFGVLYAMNNNDMMRTLDVVSNNAYNMVRVEARDGGESKIFDVNRSASSKISSDPDKFFEYWKFVQERFIAPIETGNTEPKDILVLGAGGFTIGLHDVKNRYTYIDIDKALKPAAEAHFLPEKLTPNKQFIAASARAFVHGNKARYDIVLIDTYTNVVSIPMETITREFLLDVKKLLKPGGIVIANIISDPTFADRFSVRYYNTFASVFPVFAVQSTRDFDVWQPRSTEPQRRSAMRNVLYIYYDQPHIDDRERYTDDRNTYSLDRN